MCKEEEDGGRGRVKESRGQVSGEEGREGGGLQNSRGTPAPAYHRSGPSHRPRPGLAARLCGPRLADWLSGPASTQTHSLLSLVEPPQAHAAAEPWSPHASLHTSLHIACAVRTAKHISGPVKSASYKLDKPGRGQVPLGCGCNPPTLSTSTQLPLMLLQPSQLPASSSPAFEKDMSHG